MPYIIYSEKLERVKFGCVATGIAFTQILLFRHGDQHRINTFVDQSPKRNDIIFFGCLVIIGSYPEVLIIKNMRWLIFVLATDKSAQVVVAGVDEMSENFLLAPLMRIGLGQKIMIGKSV